MKLARAQDFRRRLQEKGDQWPVRLNRVSFNGIPSLGEGDIPLLSPLTVFCGPNGVGKTTLLRAVWATLDPVSANSSKAKSIKIPSGTATVDLTREGVLVSTTRAFANGKAELEPAVDVEVIHIDTASDAGKLQDLYAGSGNPDDIINGSGPKLLTDRERKQINYLTRRDYREINLYEVEVSAKTTPFFEVILGPNRYDSRTMGGGEFAAFFLWWALDRASPHSILLIEEPETFLSPGSQSAFVDHLLSVAWQKKISIILTSHSGELIAPLPEESVRFLHRDHAGTRLVTDRPSPVLLETIGIRTPIDILAFVEDEAAASFCRLWVETHEPYLSRRMQIVVRDGDGAIINILRCIDSRYDQVTILAIFDGDMRGRLPADVATKGLFLPGDRPIEEIFRSMITNDASKLSNALGGRDVSDLLFALQGSDLHDWFLGLSKALGQHPSQTFMMLHAIWMQTPENRELAKAAFDLLKNAIDPVEQAAIENAA